MLPVATKEDSQEICFITDGNYAFYIEEYADHPISGEGDLIDENGWVLGKHKEIIHYIVGQRKGLGLSLRYPMYIDEIRAENNTIVLAKQKAIYSKELICKDLHFMSIEEPAIVEEITCTVKIRYHHPGQVVKSRRLKKGLCRFFNDPIRAPAPGQSTVFYDEEDCVIDEGIISKVIY